jgi:hypothetical protein
LLLAPRIGRISQLSGKRVGAFVIGQIKHFNISSRQLEVKRISPLLLFQNRGSDATKMDDDAKKLSQSMQILSVSEE